MPNWKELSNSHTQKSLTELKKLYTQIRKKKFRKSKSNCELNFNTFTASQQKVIDFVNKNLSQSQILIILQGGVGAGRDFIFLRFLNTNT